MAEVHRAVRAVGGLKQNFATKQPTVKTDGSRIQGPEELSQLWHDFLAGKFSETELESARREYELPVNNGEGALTEAEFRLALSRLKKQKAPGPDGIPAEIWKGSTVASSHLFRFIRKIWDLEHVPQSFVLCIFVLIYKNKGSSDDCKKYRAIGLLNHSYKIMNIVLLQRLIKETKGFLSD